MTSQKVPTGAVAVGLALAVGGCSTPAANDEGSTEIMVSFSALEFVADRVGGADAEVASMTPVGADPHSVELSGSRVADLHEVDLVVTVSGLQPSTDDALAQIDDVPVVDTLDAAYADVEPATGDREPPDPERDPHFWLDPVRLALTGHQVADALAEIDPAHAEAYQERADDLDDELGALDQEYAAALAPCAGATVVTSHEAFGYLAARYDLDQVGISGVNPEVEPSPSRMREVVDIVNDTGAETLFFEVNTSDAVAEQLAEELDISTGVLDPMERPRDADYMTVMRENLDALTDGLVCAGSAPSEAVTDE